MKRLFAILCVLMFAVNVYAADIKISELPVVTSVTPATDIVPVVASGATSQVTVTNLMKGANAGTATALAADPADCAAGQVATGIAASGALSCTATPTGLTSVGATTFTGALTGTASGNIPNSLADAKGDLAVASADNTWGRMAHPGAANYVLTTNATDTLAWAATHSHSDSAAQFYNATNTTRLIKNDASGITADSKTYTIKPITDVDVTFSPGKTFTDAKWCTYATATGLTCNQAAPAGTGDILADGSVAFTGAPIPSAANTVALGSAAAEWSDIYLGDGAVIYGENDSSNTITSSSTAWTFAKDVVVTGADLTLGTGIKATGGAGTITFTDLAGTSEVLAIDLRTENTAKFTTSSGVTAADFSALNLVTTGTISGAIPIVTDANGLELTAAQCYGYLHVATGAGTWLLPAAAAGMNLCLLSTAASEIIIDIDASDDITLVGVQDTDGDGITNASGEAAGDFVCLIAIDATHWYVMGKQGTWAAQ